jgi:biopolymer transport protein ExbD
MTDTSPETETQEEAVQEEEGWSADDEALFLRRKHRKHSELIEGLNLTAMMDMMTIILVFLIKQYASAPENISLSESLQPPISTSDANIQPAVSIFITKVDIIVDGDKVADISNWKIVSKEGDPLLPLSSKLKKIVDRLKLIEEKTNGASPFDGRVMLVVDEEVPYDLLNMVLMTAGRNEFNSYRLIVKDGSKKAPAIPGRD